MTSFLVWSQFVRPGLFDLSEDTAKFIAEWKNSSKTDPNKIEDQPKARMLGDAILEWCHLNWSKLTAPKGEKI
jgi:hypothetical protein